ncbi:MAG TPA: DUF4175 family protein [Polyangiaceae bacterium]
MPAGPALEKLVRTWQAGLGRARGRAASLSLLAVVLCAAHVARVGTGPARAAAAASIAIVLGVLCVSWWRERRRFADTRRLLRTVLRRTDRDLCDRSLRAFNLVERTARDQTLGSSSLAQLHFERVLARAQPGLVAAAAARHARTWRRLALGFALCGLLAVAVGPRRLFEGLDVLVARRGVAPVPLRWLDHARISSQAPHYLRQGESALYQGFANQQPSGSVLSVRGMPRHAERQLVLSDGEREVPFVSDGAGGVVARWTLKDTARLRVAARFGDVLIPEPDTLQVSAALDRAPRIELEGAPRTLQLKDVERIELRFVARDDHGLSQVDLVLRSGNREERRVLAKLNDEGSVYRGGHALDVRDPFLRRVFLPVVVSIEARDNDAVDGPKWGKSATFSLMPPALGEPEATRYATLERALQAVLGLLSAQLGPLPEKDAKQRAAARKLVREQRARTLESVRTALSAGTGLPLPSGLRAFVAGQVRLLERPRPAVPAVRNTEEVLLAMDAALRGLAVRDARSVAKRLAEVADEAADGAKQARETERQEAGVQRLDAAVLALGASAAQLLQLGALGHDLGNVARADLGRVKRARERGDLLHAELAARHMAERLRRPNPSFGARGTSHAGGVEAGAGGGSAPSDEASQADQRFNQLASELEELASEHAGGVGQVEKALEEAERAADLAGLRDEAKERADAIRRAANGLPQLGAEPGSAQGSAALGREHAASMAQGLEQLDLAAAVERGRDSLAALNAAESAGASAMDWVDRDAVRAAKGVLQEQLAWAERQLNAARQSAAARARDTLNQASGQEQELARRAGNLAGRGEGEAALPEEALRNLEHAERSMQEAARELQSGNGERGLELQREAQRLLEEASSGRTDRDEQEPSGEQQRGQRDVGGDLGRDGDVPDKANSEDAEAFRRRVLEGLAKGKDGRLSPAIKRYAEGLLR